MAGGRRRDVLLIGGLTLAEHLTGWDFGIDQWFFREPPGEPGTASPNRPGLPASVGFVLAGSCLLLLRLRPSSPILYQLLAVAVGLVASLSILGYAFGTTALYGLPKYTGIALHTSVALTALAAGLLLVRPNQGIAAIVFDQGIGGSVARRLLPPRFSCRWCWVGCASKASDCRYTTRLCTAIVMSAHRRFLRARSRAICGVASGRSVSATGGSEGQPEPEDVFPVGRSSPFGIYVVDSQFRIAQMNIGSQNRAFRNVRPVIGRDFAEAMRILGPNPLPRESLPPSATPLKWASPRTRRALSTRHDVETVESYKWELHRMTLPDGQYGVICYYFDSTTLREAEAAVRESEARLATDLEAMTRLRNIACSWRKETWNRFSRRSSTRRSPLPGLTLATSNSWTRSPLAFGSLPRGFPHGGLTSGAASPRAQAPAARRFSAESASLSRTFGKARSSSAPRLWKSRSKPACEPFSPRRW